MSTYTHRIEVGQRWRSRDKRDYGRTVTVIAHSDRVNEPGNNGFVVVSTTARRSTMRARTLHTRYSLVAPNPERATSETDESEGEK